MSSSSPTTEQLDLWVADDGAALHLRAGSAVEITDADRAQRTVAARPLEDGTFACDDAALRAIERDVDGTRVFAVSIDGARTEYVRCAIRSDPHPRCVTHPYFRQHASYWRLSSHDEAPSVRGAQRPLEDALGVIEPRCVRCGRLATVTQRTDDSGTGWRQLYTVLHCARCGRWSLWHYDD